jgi:sugar-specific transcriptional regulator TrmB
MQQIERLIEFGLTRQEANIYLVLISDGPFTGYEAAKQTATSRSNTYAALTSLIQKGAANLNEGPVNQYSAVTPEEFFTNKIRELQSIKAEFLNNLSEKVTEVEGYITITGGNQIVHKLKNMLNEAKERVYMVLSNDILIKLDLELKACIERGIKLVIISDKELNIKNITMYISNIQKDQIRLIVDSTNVLTGDISDSKKSTCLFSKKKNLVDLFKEAIRNEIHLLKNEKQ